MMLLAKLLPTASINPFLSCHDLKALKKNTVLIVWNGGVDLLSRLIKE
jgi:hypothetical protein